MYSVPAARPVARPLVSVVPISEIPVPETSYTTEEQCPLSERPQLRSAQVCDFPVDSIVASVMSQVGGVGVVVGGSSQAGVHAESSS